MSKFTCQSLRVKVCTVKINVVTLPKITNMRIETDNLLTVKSYSEIKGQSLTWIYSQIKSGAVKSVTIDGVKFVITK